MFQLQRIKNKAALKQSKLTLAQLDRLGILEMADELPVIIIIIYSFSLLFIINARSFFIN
jgi:hypothetical protein